ncbi:hypothetical protein ACFOW1_15825 [Parasediminibacterium paludis]|uniref:Uncharacterized protein n=1 Tax=Parasediminibacterium paludis TaxID=908966 RepID=A0ABV8Q1G5_9BACT
MESSNNIFQDAISIEELEARLEMSGTGMFSFISDSSCITSTPTLPGTV